MNLDSNIISGKIRLSFEMNSRNDSVLPNSSCVIANLVSGFVVLGENVAPPLEKTTVFVFLEDEPPVTGPKTPCSH
jgi:hypothetical protein